MPKPHPLATSSARQPNPCLATPPISTVPDNLGVLPVFAGPIRPHWQAAARAKGFDIVARVLDRYHLRLRCQTCGGNMVSKLYVVTSSCPICPHCLTARRQATANAAGVNFLGQDADRPAYGFFRADCGHTLRRQFEIVERAARGTTGLRCEICLIRREEVEARRLGWQRVGNDTGRSGYYRLYRHRCGHVQSIAPVNMAWGQCDCAGCGQSWSSRPSFIYLFDIRLPAGAGQAARHYLKLGYSAHPDKRHRHQLGLPPGAEVEVLRILPMPTGHAACAAETAAHRRLTRAHPGAVVPADEFAGVIKVTREIYRPALRAVIEAEMDKIEVGADAGRLGSSAAGPNDTMGQQPGEDKDDMADDRRPTARRTRPDRDGSRHGAA
ncbi:hypothetical protein [Paracoccus sp. Ld10]|uniref:hypothetical protein n=1 Tax=Paracoccus sp. Ld10 TaxID=649158 RepID=UPI0038662026